MTANALFVLAAVEGLRALDRPQAVTVYAASDYLIRGASQWVRGWQQRGWLSKNGRPVKNRAVWESLLDAARPHRVEWRLAREDGPVDDIKEAKQIASDQVGQ
jgi:ribonuclease HI